MISTKESTLLTRKRDDTTSMRATILDIEPTSTDKLTEVSRINVSACGTTIRPISPSLRRRKTAGVSYHDNARAPPYSIFPLRLHDIISNESNNDIIRWISGGKAFVIEDKKRFMSEILPICFPQHCKFTSFTRKLSRWCFTRIARGPLIGAYHHPIFMKGCRVKCYEMTCNSNKPAREQKGKLFLEAPSSTTQSLQSNKQVVESMLTKTMLTKKLSLREKSRSDVEMSIPPMPVLAETSLAVKSCKEERLPRTQEPTWKSSKKFPDRRNLLAIELCLKQLREIDTCILALQQQNYDQQLLYNRDSQVQLAQERAETEWHARIAESLVLNQEEELLGDRISILDTCKNNFITSRNSLFREQACSFEGRARNGYALGRIQLLTILRTGGLLTSLPRYHPHSP